MAARRTAGLLRLWRRGSVSRTDLGAAAESESGRRPAVEPPAADGGVAIAAVAAIMRRGATAAIVAGRPRAALGLARECGCSSSSAWGFN